MVRKNQERMHCNTLEELDRAYIAGLVDADGCIQISKRCPGKRTNYALEVTVSNTDTRIINYLKNTVGGGVKEDIRRHRKLVCFGWVITSSAAMELLEQIKPYLQSKKDEAEISIIFQQMPRIQGKHKSAIEWQIDEILYNKCRELKHSRGISISSQGGQQ